MSTPGFSQNPYMGAPPQVPPTAPVPYGPSAQKPNTIYCFLLVTFYCACSTYWFLDFYDNNSYIKVDRP